MWNSLYRRFCLLTVLSALSVMAFAQSGDENFDRAEQLYKEQNFKKAVVFYKKSADDGNVSAQYALANCYYYGQGVDRNVNTAVEMWLKCADEIYHQRCKGRCLDFWRFICIYGRSRQMGNADGY